MKFVIVPDSFKGSLSASEAAQAIEAGIRRARPDVQMVTLPVADGGEGTLDSLLTATGGSELRRHVCGPLGEKVDAAIGLLPSGETVIVEMAQAAGLLLISESERNPLRTTTYGVGELMMSAAFCGVSTMIVGIGGSCTNDGGVGAMQALGIQFLNSDNKSINSPATGADLIDLHHIDMSAFRFPKETIQVLVASDVTNPLIGPSGASTVYGPQKGATPAMIERLEAGLTNFAEVVKRDLGFDVADLPGAGAAGGLGASLLAFLDARMVSGIDLVLDMIGFDNEIADADFVFTGEGRIDGQTLQGKVIAGVLRRCKSKNVPVIAFCGAVDNDATQHLKEAGVQQIVSIADSRLSLDDNIKNAEVNLEQEAYATVATLGCQ